MTENKEMSLEEVKNSQKKIAILFCELTLLLLQYNVLKQEKGHVQCTFVATTLRCISRMVYFQAPNHEAWERPLYGALA